LLLWRYWAFWALIDDTGHGVLGCYMWVCENFHDGGPRVEVVRHNQSQAHVFLLPNSTSGLSYHRTVPALCSTLAEVSVQVLPHFYPILLT
jgi:hypothetical protein